MRSVRGNIHQGQVQCRGQGFQCTIIAVTALLGFYCGQLDLLNLHANSVDRIVYSGSKLYDEVVQSSPRYLEHREIPTNIEIFNNDFYLEVYSELFYGVIGQHGNPIAQSYSILKWQLKMHFRCLTFMFSPLGVQPLVYLQMAILFTYLILMQEMLQEMYALTTVLQ